MRGRPRRSSGAPRRGRRPRRAPSTRRPRGRCARRRSRAATPGRSRWAGRTACARASTRWRGRGPCEAAPSPSAVTATEPMAKRARDRLVAGHDVADLHVGEGDGAWSGRRVDALGGRHHHARGIGRDERDHDLATVLGEDGEGRHRLPVLDVVLRAAQGAVGMQLRRQPAQAPVAAGLDDRERNGDLAGTRSSRRPPTASRAATAVSTSDDGATWAPAALGEQAEARDAEAVLLEADRVPAELGQQRVQRGGGRRRRRGMRARGTAGSHRRGPAWATERSSRWSLVSSRSIRRSWEGRGCARR